MAVAMAVVDIPATATVAAAAMLDTEDTAEATKVMVATVPVLLVVGTDPRLVTLLLLRHQQTTTSIPSSHRRPHPFRHWEV
mmetsp:Transcript_9192/g.26284  ORF Transcript_9192/g.26284 Transcript_9192/m.26284 type:complete len:81 (+) Transcript_9192:1-243(+)